MRALDSIKERWVAAAGIAALASCRSAIVCPGAPTVAVAVVVVDSPSATTKLTLDQLEALGPVDVAWTHHEQTHLFRCVPLTKVIGNELALRALVNPSRDTWTRAVLVTARDGYRAVFSAGELRENWGPTHAFLAWRQDGAPLSNEDGPLRLVVPTDGGGARCVRQVEKIAVVDVAALAKPATTP